MMSCHGLGLPGPWGLGEGRVTGCKPDLPSDVPRDEIDKATGLGELYARGWRLVTVTTLPLPKESLYIYFLERKVRSAGLLDALRSGLARNNDSAAGRP
jgi:hypothetical protein